MLPSQQRLLVVRRYGDGDLGLSSVEVEFLPPEIRLGWE